MRYEARFSGRKIGAIGIFQRFAVVVEAADPEAARLKLYDTHEHISSLTLTAEDGRSEQLGPPFRPQPRR